MLKEFKAFIQQGNVMDLAVGVIIGAAFGKIVDALVTGLLTPIIGLAMGGMDMSNLFVTLKDGATKAGPYSNLKEATDAGANVLAYGSFLQAIFMFLITSFVIFIMVKAMNKMRAPKVEEAPPTPADVLLLEEIRDLMKAKA